MPVAALLGAAQAIGGLAGQLKPSSESRASKVVGSVVNSALSGNLTAVQVLDFRRGIGIAKERAVWAQAFNSLPPDVITLYTRFKNQLPTPLGGQDTPETAAAWALNHVLTSKSFVAGASGPGSQVAPDGTALTLAGMGTARSPVTLLVILALAGAAAWWFLRRKR